jgi:hypothetical protein
MLHTFNIIFKRRCITFGSPPTPRKHKGVRTSGAYRHAAKCQSPPFLAEGTRGGAVPDSPLGNAISINNYQMK